VFDPSVTFLWAVGAAIQKPTFIPVGGDWGGRKARLFVTDPQGNIETLAELTGSPQPVATRDRQRSIRRQLGRADTQARRAFSIYLRTSRTVWLFAPPNPRRRNNVGFGIARSRPIGGPEGSEQPPPLGGER